MLKFNLHVFKSYDGKTRHLLTFFDLSQEELAHYKRETFNMFALEDVTLVVEVVSGV